MEIAFWGFETAATRLWGPQTSTPQPDTAAVTASGIHLLRASSSEPTTPPYISPEAVNVHISEAIMPPPHSLTPGSKNIATLIPTNTTL